MKYDGEITLKALAKFFDENPNLNSVEITEDRFIEYFKLITPDVLYFRGIPIRKI